MELRSYQKNACDEAIKSRVPCVITAPCGAGKSVIAADIARRAAAAGLSTIILAHRKELVLQDAEAVERLWGNRPAILSASVGEFALGKITVAQTQTAARRLPKMTIGGMFGSHKFDVCILDECQTLDHTGAAKQTVELLTAITAQNPSVRHIGLSATPYRTSGGYVFGEGKFYRREAYSIDYFTLFEAGDLTRPRYFVGTGGVNIDDANLRTVAGEFSADDEDKELSIKLAGICADIKKREACVPALVFTRLIATARKAVEFLGEGAAMVSEESTDDERAEIVRRFRAGDIKYLVNCGVFTVGFDAPNCRAVILIRATQSPGLYSQMVGRALRVCEGKDSAYVIDYGGNIFRHGHLEDVQVDDENGEKKKERKKKPYWECRNCGAVLDARPEGKNCPTCGAFIGAVEKIASFDEEEVYDVRRTMVNRHASRRDPSSTGIRITVETKDVMVDTNTPFLSDFLLFDHQNDWVANLAREKARRWFLPDSRGCYPKTTQEALSGKLRIVRRVARSVSKKGFVTCYPIISSTTGEV